MLAPPQRLGSPCEVVPHFRWGVEEPLRLIQRPGEPLNQWSTDKPMNASRLKCARRAAPYLWRQVRNRVFIVNHTEACSTLRSDNCSTVCISPGRVSNSRSTERVCSNDREGLRNKLESGDLGHCCTKRVACHVNVRRSRPAKSFQGRRNARLQG